MRWVALAIAGFGALAALPSHAQQYPANVPVCMQVYGRVNYTECSYTSLAQCQLSASGRAAQCIVNPYFAGDARGPRDYRQFRLSN